VKVFVSSDEILMVNNALADNRATTRSSENSQLHDFVKVFLENFNRKNFGNQFFFQPERATKILTFAG